ncbi:MAG TPA: glycosyltransferase family 2 protein [Chloroflexota bacterium]|nr:glycosyltransferase family 2 protein [Chloroflexota bacterium]
MPQAAPMVGVVIVNWNGRAHLERCLDALARQTMSSFEIVVVDNGSVDGSAEMVRDQYPHVRLLRQSANLGFAEANNVGIGAGETAFVATLNNDTEPRPDWLEQLLAPALTDDRVGMVASKMLFAHRPGVINSAGIALDRAGIAWDRLGGRPDGQTGPPEEVFGPCAGAALYRRRMLDEIGLFDGEFFAYLEDVDLAWRARLAGWRCVYAPAAAVTHVHSATGVEGSPFKSYQLGRNKLWTIVKNYPSPQLFLALPLIVSYDLAAVAYGIVARRDLAALRGRVAGLAGLPRQWRKRKAVQRLRRVSFSDLAKQLSPVATPFGVLARYRHLRVEEAC